MPDRELIAELQAERDGYAETARQATAIGIDQAARIAELDEAATRWATVANHLGRLTGEVACIVGCDPGDDEALIPGVTARIAELEYQRNFSTLEFGRLTTELTRLIQWEAKAQVRLNDYAAQLESRDRVLTEARARIAQLETERDNALQTTRDSQRVSSEDHMQLSWERDLAREERDVAQARITELETFVPGLGSGNPMPLSAFATWLQTGSRGHSSDAIVGALTGRRTLPGRPVVAGIDWPRDRGDFWRCENLLRAVPEARQHMELVADISPEWAALVAHWDGLACLDRQPLTDRIRQLTDVAGGQRHA